MLRGVGWSYPTLYCGNRLLLFFPGKVEYIKTYPRYFWKFSLLKTRKGLQVDTLFFWGFWFSFFKGEEVEWSDVWCLGVFFFFFSNKKKKKQGYYVFPPGSRGEGGTFRVWGEGKGFCAKTEMT